MKHSQSLLSDSQSPLPKTFAKSRELCRLSGETLFRSFGVERALFVTLTFPHKVTSLRDAHKKLNSFLTSARKRYDGSMWVVEPHSSGSIHYHLLLVSKGNVHTGTYVRGFEPHLAHTDEEKRRFMGPALREEADWIAKHAPRHGFGRVEVAPVYSEDPMAVVHYMVKFKWIGGDWPFDEKRYVRLWSRSRSVRAGTIQFSWIGEKARLWREKLKAFILSALDVAADDHTRIRELEETGLSKIRQKCGRAWFLSFKTWAESCET